MGARVATQNTIIVLHMEGLWFSHIQGGKFSKAGFHLCYAKVDHSSVVQKILSNKPQVGCVFLLTLHDYIFK